MQEKRMDDFWNVDSNRNFVGFLELIRNIFTLLERKTFQRIHVVWRGD